MIYAVNRKTRAHRVAERYGPISEDEDIIHAYPDGWIPWQSGECPLPGERLTNVRQRGDQRVLRLYAKSVNWAEVIAYRPILDAKPEPPAWDGESWPPPIGSVIESSATWKDGTPAEVLAVRHGKVIGCHVETGVAGWLEREFCRPIRSEEDKITEAIYQACGVRARDGGRQVAADIYTAIRDGDIPGIMLGGAS